MKRNILEYFIKRLLVEQSTADTGVETEVPKRVKVKILKKYGSGISEAYARDAGAEWAFRVAVIDRKQSLTDDKIYDLIRAEAAKYPQLSKYLNRNFILIYSSNQSKSKHIKLYNIWIFNYESIVELRSILKDSKRDDIGADVITLPMYSDRNSNISDIISLPGQYYSKDIDPVKLKKFKSWIEKLKRINKFVASPDINEPLEYSPIESVVAWSLSFYNKPLFFTGDIMHDKEFYTGYWTYKKPAVDSEGNVTGITDSDKVLIGTYDDKTGQIAGTANGLDMSGAVSVKEKFTGEAVNVKLNDIAGYSRVFTGTMQDNMRKQGITEYVNIDPAQIHKLDSVEYVKYYFDGTYNRNDGVELGKYLDVDKKLILYRDNEGEWDRTDMVTKSSSTNRILLLQQDIMAMVNNTTYFNDWPGTPFAGYTPNGIWDSKFSDLAAIINICLYPKIGKNAIDTGTKKPWPEAYKQIDTEIRELIIKYQTESFAFK